MLNQTKTLYCQGDEWKSTSVVDRDYLWADFMERCTSSDKRPIASYTRLTGVQRRKHYYKILLNHWFHLHWRGACWLLEEEALLFISRNSKALGPRACRLAWHVYFVLGYKAFTGLLLWLSVLYYTLCAFSHVNLLLWHVDLERGFVTVVCRKDTTYG